MGSGLKKGLLALSMAVIAATTPMRASADEWPMAPGDFWEMTAVHLKDGGALAYVAFLAAEWKADQEFAKSKGWIKGYAVLSNVHGRKGEPDLYLVAISERLASGPESEKRDAEYNRLEEEDAGTDAEGVRQPGRDPRNRQLHPVAGAEVPQVMPRGCGAGHGAA